MADQKQTIAFFGATGGCASSSLACALREGHYCTALVRTPSKLYTILETQHSIPTSTIKTHLTTIQGDALSPTAVSRTLISPLDTTKLVDTIYTAIGAYPAFRPSLTTPFVLPDPTLCTSGVRAIFAALADVPGTTAQGGRPLLVAISSTGVNARTRDVPWLYGPVYRWLAAQPHADKRGMERVIFEQADRYLRAFVVIRPTVLVGGERGVDRVRCGWEWGIEREGEEAGPAVGWTVGRRDVGAWVFERVLRVAGGGWEGKCVSLTY